MPAVVVPAPVTQHEGDRFGEMWFSEENQQVLAALVEDTDTLPGLVVEVGSWTGRSTVVLANACYPSVVHAVDTWEGSPGEISTELAQQRDIHAEFQRNIRDLTRLNVEEHRMGWREWFAVNLSPIRFLFIDAEHTYREVHDNITAALPQITPGGIVCGDDAHHPPVAQAVIEHFPEASVSGTVWWTVVCL